MYFHEKILFTTKFFMPVYKNYRCLLCILSCNPLITYEIRKKCVLFNLFHNVVILNLDTYFVNIFSSVSSYCVYLLSPVLIVYTHSQKVTDVPLITNVEDWIYSWKSLEEKREILWIIQTSLSLFLHSIFASVLLCFGFLFFFFFRSLCSLKSSFSPCVQNAPLKEFSLRKLSEFRLAFDAPNLKDTEHINFSEMYNVSVRFRP